MKITDENIGKRADVFVKEKLEKNALSRTFIAENLVKFFKVNDREVKPSYKFKKGDTYSIDYENLKRLVSNLTNEESLIAQKKDLDIIYEDENCLVINKESGIVVHPGSGNKQNTLANYVKGYLEAKGEFEALRSKLMPDIDVKLNENKEEILDILSAEIIKRYYYQKGVIEYSLVNDVDLKTAIEVLGKPEIYNKLLQPQVQ